MPALLLILLVAVLGWMWWTRRGSTLTRTCRWRQDRRAGVWRCAACGAECPLGPEPRHCLRQA
jgi:hypothetical protein